MTTATNANRGPNFAKRNDSEAHKPGGRRYNRRGGRPPLTVDFKAVCDAVQGAWQGNGESITEVAARFGVSRGWIWKWVYPALELRGSTINR